MIYHITTALAAGDASESGEYVTETFSLEGFIHCSHAQQVREVANRRFQGRADLVLLEIDPARLRCPVVDENLEGGTELYPHIYGHLPMRAVVHVHEFPCDADGRFSLPAAVEHS